MPHRSSETQVWDENHRNNQFDQVPMLIKRDRNHPSVVIWSICNEVLCNTGTAQDAKAMANLMHALDPYSGRPVSANQNGYIGPDTPLDVQGFDYATSNYGECPNTKTALTRARAHRAPTQAQADPNRNPRRLHRPNKDHWHQQAPNIPSISSETSSAVSDRGEYANDAAGGHVTGYDNQYPGWGESAEQAWGGVDESNVQGILTRPFISGGWTWTG